MKTVLLAFLFAITAMPAAPRQNGAVVRGIVREIRSSEPIPGAEVTLAEGLTGGSAAVVIRLVPAPGTPAEVVDRANEELAAARGQQRPAPFMATTDASGRFEILNVPAGTYTLAARRDGFVGPRSSNGVSPPNVRTSLIITENQSPPLMALPLVRAATVRGRVVDPSGTPVPQINVTPALLSYRNGKPALVAGGPSAMTDAAGRYQMTGLGPGEYYIAAGLQQQWRLIRPGQPWVRTFYPGVADPLTTTPIVVAEGGTREAIDITLQSMRTFTIRGRAMNPLPSGSPRRLSNGDIDPSVPTFALALRGSTIDEGVPPQIPNAITRESGRRNGEFEIRDVPPGLYDLFPVMTLLLDGEPRAGSGRTVVEVRNNDVEGLVLVVSPGVDLRGLVKLNGNAAAFNPGAHRVILRPLDNLPTPIASRIGAQPVDPSGQFTVRHVPEGLFTLALAPMPANTYIEDIRQNDTSVFDSGFAVEKVSPAPLEVVLNSNGQTLEGTVTDSQKNPVRGAFVVLVPPEPRRRNAALYRVSTSSIDGSFRVTGIAPGNYKVFAWSDAIPTAWLDARFLARHEDQGRAVNVKNGTNSRLTLQAIQAGR